MNKTAHKKGGAEIPAALTRATDPAHPAPEIETAEWLAARGWERLTMIFESERQRGEEWRESEILADPDGQLWLVTDWHGQSGIPDRAERRRITRAAACARIARAMIPESLQGDFIQCTPPRLRLETAIQEARAFMLLVSDAEGWQRYGSFTGEKGEAIQAGIVSLSHRLGDELAAAFYAAEEGES